jgi:hypothetical protein
MIKRTKKLIILINLIHNNNLLELMINTRKLNIVLVYRRCFHKMDKCNHQFRFMHQLQMYVI